MKRAIIALVIVGLLLFGCSGESESSATAKGAAAREKPYVASVDRDPFHGSACKWAAKISERNLYGYDTREQAIEDGHRPCKVCRP